MGALGGRLWQVARHVWQGLRAQLCGFFEYYQKAPPADEPEELRFVVGRSCKRCWGPLWQATLLEAASRRTTPGKRLTTGS